MPTTNSLHQAARRARLLKAGKRTITLVVDDQMVCLLRRLAGQHGKTQGEVFALGVLAANRLLAGTAQAAPAARRSVLATTRPATDAPLERATVPEQGPALDLQSRPAETWWPENFETLLEEGSNGAD